jgi:CheY-like chemotaxis protein
VHSGGEALQVAVTFDPQLVLLDIGLPDMSGYDVAQRLRTLLPAARLVAISGYGQAEDRKRSAAAGFHAHLVKPLDIAQLEEVLSR